MKYNILRKINYGWVIWDTELTLAWAGTTMAYYSKSLFKDIPDDFKIVIV